jgi:hypothetical protein
MQTSAAGNFQPTESLFAVYREPFFNTIGQKPKSSERANAFRFASVCGRLRGGKNFFHVCSIGRCARVFGL